MKRVLKASDVKDAIKEDTALINYGQTNETGKIFQSKKLELSVKEVGVLFNGCNSNNGKLPVDVQDLM